MHMDRLAQEESPPTVPAHTLGDPTVAATRGNIRETSTLDGNSWETTTTHGSFTRYLAKLAKLMFTQQGPYRDTEEGDPLDPDTHGKPPGDISATLGNLTPLMAAPENLTRRLIMAFQGPTEAAQDLPHSKDNLPYLPKGNLTEVTSGITKEITTNSQDPDQTLNYSRPTCRRPTRSHHEVTKDLSRGFTIYHYLPYLADTILSPHFYRMAFTVNSPQHFLPYSPPRHHSFISPSHLPYPPHHHYFTNPSHLSHHQRLQINRHHTFHISRHHHYFTQRLFLFSSHHHHSIITSSIHGFLF